MWFKDEAWVKSKDPECDVTTGGNDGAKICELVGLYLLNKIAGDDKPFSKDDVGLYRDDGLGKIKGSGPEIDAKRKKCLKS